MSVLLCESGVSPATPTIETDSETIAASLNNCLASVLVIEYAMFGAAADHDPADDRVLVPGEIRTSLGFSAESVVDLARRLRRIADRIG